jgi:hypothetical protein
LPNALAILLTIVLALTYSVRQAILVRRMFPGESLRSENLQRLLYGGFAITAALLLNSLGFLNQKIWEFENYNPDDVLRPGRVIEEPSLFGLVLAQIAIIGGTLVLVDTVWRAIRRGSSELEVLTKASILGVASRALQSLLLPFWLAAFGIGSIFGISSGVGLREIVRNTEFVVGPSLILAFELTFIWLVTKIGLWRATPSGDIPPLFQFLFPTVNSGDRSKKS